MYHCVTGFCSIFVLLLQGLAIVVLAVVVLLVRLLLYY
jgi:hypothetical protein